MFRVLAAGLVLGFAVAASPGPVWFLCARRTLDRGWGSGLASGLGVATVDGFYAAVAAFGLAAIAAAAAREGVWLRLAGGAVLLLIGLRLAIASPTRREAASGGSLRLAGDYASMVALTLTNPTTILTFAALGAGLGLTARQGFVPALVLLVGVGLGSAAWWAVLAAVMNRLRHRLGSRTLRFVSVAAGAAICVFGLVAIAAALAELPLRL